MEEEYNFSFRCFFGGTSYNAHYQRLRLSDVARWIEAYRFTHPNCTSISFKVWFTEMPADAMCEDEE